MLKCDFKSLFKNFQLELKVVNSFYSPLICSLSLEKTTAKEVHIRDTQNHFFRMLKSLKFLLPGRSYHSDQDLS